MALHVVRAGDCISSIAATKAMRWQDVWDHGDNASLRELRTDPNVLAVGDSVAIPDTTPKAVTVPTDQLHKFVVVAPRVALRLRLVLDGEACANEPYRLEVVGRIFTGETDDEGRIQHDIPARATEATLKLTRRRRRYVLALGTLAPADTPGGACERLRNLGLYAGPACTELTPALRGSLRRAQKLDQLETTGELDADTVRALLRRHGC
jgi:hypothetical protein